MIAKVPKMTYLRGDTIAKGVNDIKETKNDKFHREILQDLRNSLSKVLLPKDCIDARIDENLTFMYESIRCNPGILNLLNRIKQKDQYTFRHSLNTAYYSMFIANWVGLNGQQITCAAQSGLLHDIGKIFIPDEILNKKGRLSETEYEEIKNHTLYGYFLLDELEGFSREVRRAVLFHHERTDSSGYPLGATEDYVGIIPKIVAVADVYDAITTDRVYKKGSSTADAIKFLSTDGMRGFDKDVLGKFLVNLQA